MFKECWLFGGKGKSELGGLEAKGREWFRREHMNFITLKMTVIKKKVENKTIREDMEKLEPSCVASGNIT